MSTSPLASSRSPLAVTAAALAVTLTMLAGPAPAPASSALTRAAAPDSALAVHLARLPGELITLAAALREAWTADTALAAARAELAAARGAEHRQRGFFQPEVFGRAELGGEEQPSASFFAGADVLETERALLSAGAGLRLPWGTRLGASLSSTRLVTNSTFAVLSPQYDAFGELTIVQPLLQGFGPAARADLEAAVHSRGAAEHRLAEARLASQSRVELLYWSLHAAERDLVVLQLIRDQAAAFLDEVARRTEAGLTGPAEMASARAFLAQQEQALLDGQDGLDWLSDRLATLLGRRPSGGDTRFRTADQPPTELPDLPVEHLISLVQQHSRELAAAEQMVAAVRARAAGARWQALPELDLVGALGGRGLAGTGREVVIDFGGDEPTTIGSDEDGGLSDGLGQVLRRRHPTWSVGLAFRLPLGAVDRGERDRLRAEVARAEAQLEALRRELEAEVRGQHRVLDRSRQRLEFAGHGVEASLEQVRIGNLEYTEGRTTAFELVRLATDLAAAQRRYSDALVRAASAAANLRRLTGGAYLGDGLPGPDQEAATP